jgi:hypothetical protein
MAERGLAFFDDLREVTEYLAHRTFSRCEEPECRFCWEQARAEDQERTHVREIARPWWPK